jgi:glycosyltransferase involved in cell wall biosynthesis
MSLREEKGPQGRVRLAVLFSRFPVWNQTFALGDLTELVQAGFQVEIFTLLGASGSIQQPEAKNFQSDVHVASFTCWPFFRANLKASRRLLTWRLLFKLISETLSDPSEFRKSLALFPQAIYFADLMKQKGIQHIHAGWASYPATVAWIASKLTGIPFSFSAHAYDIYKVRSLLREKIQEARFVATCAETNREALLSLGGEQTRSKIYVHRHGIDLQRFHPVGSSVPKPQGVWKILACGNFVRYKGFEHLVTACGLLQKEGYRFVCSIIGEGPAEKRLAQQIRQSGLSSQVSLLPPMSQPELAEQYRNADVLVHPSVVTRDGNRDVIPNVLIEAMASGTAVISTRLSGIQELIREGKNGLLVSPGDPKELAEAISGLMEDRQKREQLVKAAQCTVAEAYDRRKNAEGLMRTFVTHIAL